MAVSILQTIKHNPATITPYCNRFPGPVARVSCCSSGRDERPCGASTVMRNYGVPVLAWSTARTSGARKTRARRKPSRMKFAGTFGPFHQCCKPSATIRRPPGMDFGRWKNPSRSGSGSRPMPRQSAPTRCRYTAHRPSGGRSRPAKPVGLISGGARKSCWVCRHILLPARWTEQPRPDGLSLPQIRPVDAV